MKPAKTSQRIIAPNSWSELPWGEYYRTILLKQMEPWWAKLFGFHLLKIGALSAELFTDKCAIPHQISLAPTGKNIHVLANEEQLPFANKSIDACLLAQTLNYSADPHRVLREVDRIIIDDGWLVMSTFNPLSILGIGKILPWLRHKHPYCSRMFTQMRLLDWLQLLNYEIMYHSSFQLLPWQRQERGASLHFPAAGCLSLIIARKRTIPVTLQPLRFSRPPLNWGGITGTAKGFPRTD